MVTDAVAGTRPITLLSGFLGSGKTTLLGHVMRQPAAARMAVLINEFGEIAIDNDLVQASADQVVALANGCICCTMQDDLVVALSRLEAQQQAGEIPPFDRVVVETTGLADPVPILRTLIAYPYLAENYTLDKVAVTFDAKVGIETLAAHETAGIQLALADRVFITKPDLVDAQALNRVETRLEQLNPQADRLVTLNGEVDAEKLIAPATPSPFGLDRFAALGEHHHHHSDIDTFSVVLGPLEPQRFVQFLENTVRDHGPRLLRVKGIVHLHGHDDGPAVFHGVQTTVHPPTWLDHWPGGDRQTRIVFITQSLDDETRNGIESELRACVHRPG